MNYMLSTIKHLFHPQESNNHRPRILHPAGLAVLVGILLLSQSSLELLKATHGIGGFVLGYASNIDAGQVVEQTNQQRSANGLPPLTVNAALNAAATAKASHMFANNYWAHFAPDGTSPWNFISNAGYNYSVAGENLARDFNDTSAVINAWMASPTHRANVVNNKYTEIGVAVVDGQLNGVETTLVVQMFGHRGTAVAAIPEESAQTAPAPAVVEETAPAPAVIEESEPAAIVPAELTNSVLTATAEKPVNTDLISPLRITKAISSAVVLLLVSVLLYDAYHSSRKKTFRLAGKNWAHFSFLAVILIIIFTLTEGAIL